ncbi:MULTISPECIES: dipeptide/oligopeptide/nickel ABC transporter permease/ATP-binding protein [unclassified Microbacterium]|uniref:dipeptide/oligopeptide/nickel ABC transporter permease/ATP-binding protein n=1 Tax=unclassified Microbacterium TaxID=2609290 RepID=UPI00097F4529|nr:dipeptide/oligopeptide/nickel ABC transporter permease/ATP-binding protein [Microbacterium sp. JB110]RCS57242.1 ATP-binding cassette domain-containing protein [Microbacterium sp. JB110]SJM59077.1 Oligopeptide transport system permease protein OppB (TC 3.A.1.5.1) [Frigoribacterium sp. JB110]
MTSSVPGRLGTSTPGEPAAKQRRRSRWMSFTGIAAAVGVAALLAIAVIGPSIWTEAATVRNIAERWAQAGAEHPFGTDDIGRDIFARVMVATRTSLLLTIGATAMLVGGGLIIGLTAALLPRRLRRALIWVMDMLLAFPWLLLVLFFTVIWDATATGAMLAIGLAGIPNVTRLVYNMAASVTDQDYVRAARVVGVGPYGIITKHVLPNIANPLLVQSAAAASTTLLAFAGLSFLGLGVQAPEYDWGRLLNEGLSHLYTNPMAALGPGIAVVFAGVVFTMIAETVGDQPGQGLRSVVRAGRGMVLGSRQKAAAPAAPERDDDSRLAEVRDLHVAFPDGEGGLVERVRGVDLRVAPGEVVGIVGESGSGKSLTAMAMAGLLGKEAAVSSSVHSFDGMNMAGPLSAADRSRLGVELGMVFQDPLTSLNPALTIGRQLTEVPEAHLHMSRAQARRRAADALGSVGIADSERRLRQYPHEFSGGMRQRAMIAMALTGRPKVIIADEPTTALDVTVQKQVMKVLRRAQEATGAAIVFISHDIALVSAFCDRVLVMKDGRVVEELDAERIQQDAKHPYTRALIACLPDMRSDRTRPLPVISEALLAEAEAAEEVSA